jgi:xanthine dehydrogenase YagR molybdenum-binding subunit
LERAHEAAGLVDARVAPAPLTIEWSADGPNLYKPEKLGPHGDADTSRGNARQALAGARTRIEQTYTTPFENHNPMEMHATVSVWQGHDHLTVYDSTQGIFGVRKKLATVFDLPIENVRVISHFVGGGFGCKGSPWSHVVLSAMAAQLARRPVKLMLTRQQMFSLVGHRPATLQRVTLAADAQGKLVAIRHVVTTPTSRFDEFIEPCSAQTRLLYACDNVDTTQRVVRLDIPTPTFMRAPGEATGTFALESAMDELAYALSIDPLALRTKNYALVDPQDAKPWSSKSLDACYQRGAERFGWARRPPQPRATREGHQLVGWGMATATYPAHQNPASAVARMRPNGSALVQAGSQDIGTGTYTIMAQLAADALGLPLERVRFELGDTAFPETPVSGGSATASSTGSAVKRAGVELSARLRDMALADPRSPLHGAPKEAIELESGELFVRSDPKRRDSYASIVARSGLPEVAVRAETKEKEGREAFSHHGFGAHFVEVRVDEELGQVRVARWVGAFAVGRILNAKTARSQLLGGIVWGMGMALHEHTVRDNRSGRVVTRDLADYHVPVHADVPNLDVIMIDEADPHVNEIGVKGIGEIGITGAAAAIANAVYHATGRRVRDLPITLDKLL